MAQVPVAFTPPLAHSLWAISHYIILVNCAYSSCFVASSPPKSVVTLLRDAHLQLNLSLVAEKPVFLQVLLTKLQSVPLSL